MAAGQDAVCGLGPAEGFRFGIGTLVGVDSLLEFGDRAEYPSLEGAVSQQREEAAPRVTRFSSRSTLGRHMRGSVE